MYIRVYIICPYTHTLIHILVRALSRLVRRINYQTIHKPIHPFTYTFINMPVVYIPG